jgi:hypothetical protein
MPKLQRAAVGGWALLDRRRVVMLITFVFAVAFSAGRLQAGDQFVRVAAAPAGLPVTHGPGYDGQFFYRLSMRPWTQQRTEFGITLDEPAYRHQRIVYPLVSFVVARGQPAGDRVGPAGLQPCRGGGVGVAGCGVGASAQPARPVGAGLGRLPRVRARHRP